MQLERTDLTSRSQIIAIIGLIIITKGTAREQTCIYWTGQLRDARVRFTYEHHRAAHAFHPSEFKSFFVKSNDYYWKQGDGGHYEVTVDYFYGDDNESFTATVFIRHAELEEWTKKMFSGNYDQREVLRNLQQDGTYLARLSPSR